MEFKVPTENRSRSSSQVEFVPAPETIYWDLPHNANGYLSNFYPSMIEIDGKRY